jgi:hypothetical protein
MEEPMEKCRFKTTSFGFVNIRISRQIHNRIKAEGERTGMMVSTLSNRLLDEALAARERISR